MGPGANAQADEIILSADFPNIHFWNQPPQKNPANAFKNLIDAAEAEAHFLVQANGGKPVKALAHSFGGHIFHQVAERNPSLFSSAVFYGTGYDVPAGFFKLLKVMGDDPSTTSELKSNIHEFLKTHHNANKADIWNYIGLIAQDPAFFRHYWPTENLFSAFVAVASKTQPMDMESFQNILNDFLSHHFHPETLDPSPWKGPVEIHLGEKDPLIEAAHETKLWQRVFPQSHIKVLKNSGHFIHFEKYLKP